MDVTRILETVGPALYILQDPALPRIAKSVRELHEIEQRSPSTTQRIGNEVPGIGLGMVAAPLELFVFARRYPIVGIAMAIAAIGIPVLIGYKLAKKRRR